MNIKDIMSIVTVALMAVGCSSDDGLQSREGRVPITLSASVGTEVTTRGVQETALASGETVYVWGKEGSGNYDYLQAWTLTAGADGALSGSAKYYPLSGETLTMVALHGNFTYTEGTSDLTATISHSVEADQSATNAYEKSDLLWASETGSSTDAANKSFDFTHKLSKIEVKLHPGEGYADISSAEVMLRGILPTIAITPSDGTLGSASGSATLIKARKTEDHLSDATPYALYEVIIPPQDAPTNFLNIKIGDKIATVAADVASFASNKRYMYDITITEFEVSVTSSITSWGSGVNAGVTQNKTVLIGRPKLPFEYVAQYNLATSSTFASDNLANSSKFFRWSTTTSGSDGPTADVQAMIKGTAVSGYHLPSCYEWMSICPPVYPTSESADYEFLDVDGERGTRITYRNGQHLNLGETLGWGVTNNSGSYSYDVFRRFLNDYNCPDDDAHAHIGYAIRFKETTGKNGIYTCAFRYEYKETDSDVDGGASLTIMINYVGPNQNVSIGTISSEDWWTLTPDYKLVLPACGYSIRGQDEDAGYYSATPGGMSASTKLLGDYLSATAYNTKYYGMQFLAGNVKGVVSINANYAYPARLFVDAH